MSEAILPQSTVPVSEIQQLRASVKEIAAALENQADILRVRGMNMPPGATQQINTIDSELSLLEKSIASDDTELAQLRTLAATSAMINSSLDLDEVLSRAMDEVLALTGAERGYIVLLNPENGELDFRVARDQENADQAITFRGSNTVLRDVLEGGQPLLTDNAYKDPRFEGRITVAQTVLRSVLCVPLIYKDRVTGAVYVDNRLRAGVFTEREKTLLVAFANQMAVAIENARLFMQVQASLEAITELKEVMSNVLDSIGSGVVTTDAEDRISLFNPAATEILGYPEEQVIGVHLNGVLPSISDEQLHEVRTSHQRVSFESQLEAGERGQRSLIVKLSPLQDAQQQTQGVAVVVDDLTEQRERDEQLNLLRRYLPPAMVDNIRDIAMLEKGGDRRELTCMYIEVRGLATFPPGTPPREIMESLNEYHEVATRFINQTEGVLDKYNGTEIMALYNTQLNPQQDHAFRALEAALMMRDEYLKVYREKRLKLEKPFFRIGIHSGIATTGNAGTANRRDFTALGDTINLAHRLLENAAPGQIIVSEACCGYIQSALGQLPPEVVFREHEPIKAKGRQQVTVVYEAGRA
jgi:PAS domain S-box-containing protein